MPWFGNIKNPKIKDKTLSTNKGNRVPEGMWVKCPQCREILEHKYLAENYQVCPECDHHMRLSAQERIDLLLDPDNFIEIAKDLESADPLGFSDTKPYVNRLKDTQQKTGLKDAMVCGEGTIHGLPLAIAAFEFRFMGGSMGSVVGEKIALTFEHALKRRIPVVVISASGGARMQEGILSLMQMAKTSALVSRLNQEGIPFISVLTDPTTGGVAASFAMLGDLIISEPKALIGFAGPRVIQQTIRQELPDGFQRAEFLLEHGFVDQIVHRSELKAYLLRALRRLYPTNSSSPNSGPASLPKKKPTTTKKKVTRTARKQKAGNGKK